MKTDNQNFTKMKLTDKQLEKVKIANWINASFIIEVQGNDKEHVKKALGEMVSRLKQERGCELYEENYPEITELKDKLFSYHVELKFLAKDFNVLIHLALLYSPSAVEIYEPQKIAIPIGDAQNILMDVANVVTQ